jgi:membrane protein DedA with SNARE-associated domain
MHFVAQHIDYFLAHYGYWAVMIFIMIESTGIPFPGETMLITAGIYAGSTHHLNLGLVIAAASAGAIVGDNFGYWIGREGGYRLLRRWGPYIRLNERKLKLGQYMFLRHGGKVVFFGRFLAVLRAWAAFLAGVNRMDYGRFLACNAGGGILWASIFGTAAYLVGDNIHRVLGPIGVASTVLAAIIILTVMIFVWRNERRLEEEAERALPGPLDHYRQELDSARKGSSTRELTPSSTDGSGNYHSSGRRHNGSSIRVRRRALSRNSW